MRSFNLLDLFALLTALQWTIALVILALALGASLALILALARSGRAKIPLIISSCFIQIIQGIPLLGLLMFFYFGIPVFLGYDIPAMAAVGVAYAVYTAAFLGDIWRGGIQAIKHAQWEAAACLGISKWQQFRYVIAPQAFRIALPASVGFLVQLVKNTSLASVVGFVELARAGQIISAGTFQPLLVYSIVAVIYFAACFPLTMWSRKLEVQHNGAR